MPEANVLYVVTAAVVVGLVLWVLFVLKSARDPWARTAPLSPPQTPKTGADDEEGASTERAASESETADQQTPR